MKSILKSRAKCPLVTFLLVIVVAVWKEFLLNKNVHRACSGMGSVCLLYVWLQLRAIIIVLATALRLSFIHKTFQLYHSQYFPFGLSKERNTYQLNIKEVKWQQKIKVIKSWNFGLKSCSAKLLEGYKDACFEERARWVRPCCEGTRSTCKLGTKFSEKPRKNLRTWS